ncbi:MAG: hypothetical protein JWN05_1800 [Arthrobacter sp.]|nr:hypothetical protein [Arthrobacter sp.]
MALQGGQPQHVLGVLRGVGRRGRCRVSRCWLHRGAQGCREYRGGRCADQELRRWGYCPRGLLGAGCPVLQGPGSSGRSVSSAGVLAGRLSACFRQRGGRQDDRTMELYGHGAGHPANNGCCLGEDRRGAAEDRDGAAAHLHESSCCLWRGEGLRRQGHRGGCCLEERGGATGVRGAKGCSAAGFEQLIRRKDQGSRTEAGSGAGRCGVGGAGSPEEPRHGKQPRKQKCARGKAATVTQAASHPIDPQRRRSPSLRPVPSPVHGSAAEPGVLRQESLRRPGLSALKWVLEVFPKWPGRSSSYSSSLPPLP